jgi:Eukaryotic aspartyl protease
MVLLTTSLTIVSFVAVIVSAAPAENEERFVIPVYKGTSGNSITAQDVLDRDLARIAAYNDKSESLSTRAKNGVAVNEDVSYVAPVSFCSQSFQLIVDTGSSNTWVRVALYNATNRADIHSYLKGWCLDLESSQFILWY